MNTVRFIKKEKNRSVPTLGFQFNGLQKYLSSTEMGEYDFKKEKNVKYSSFYLSFRKEYNSNAFFCICLTISSKSLGSGTHANVATVDEM